MPEGRRRCRDRGGWGLWWVAILPPTRQAFPVIRGSFSGNYSLDEDTPQTFILTFWSMPVENGTVYIDMGGRIEASTRVPHTRRNLKLDQVAVQRERGRAPEVGERLETRKRP